jgi:hypothetical protein
MPIEIAAGLVLAKNAIDIVKAVREAIRQKRKLTDEEMKDYLETLQDKLVDVKTALADADDENRQLKNELQEAKRMADFGAEFSTGEGLYWRDNFPYCPSCWDIERKPMRLGGPVHDPHVGEIWQCPVHKVHHITRQRH